MTTLVCENTTVSKVKNIAFVSDVEYVNEKLLESEKSPVQSIESAYLEGWK